MPITEHRVPVFSECNGFTSCRYVRVYFEEAAADDPTIEITDLDREAIEMFEALAADPELHHEFTLKSGEAVFANNFINDLDDGASLAVTLDGQLVVDLWAGVANIDLGTPWERDTLTNVWSSTKNASSLAALALAAAAVEAEESDAPVEDPQRLLQIEAMRIAEELGDGGRYGPRDLT